jgi:adenylate kinase
MRVIFIGPPGSGKGTQANLLSRRMNATAVGTGDILREAVRKGTPLGNLARPYVAAGQLVPDDLVNDIVASRFRAKDRPERFVMDGYPRTLVQAERFDEVLHEQGLDLDAVILLKVGDQEILRRLGGRGRADDDDDTVTNRLKIYERTSEPVLDYYRRRGLLVEVPGVGDVAKVHGDVVKALGDRKKT